MKALKLLVIVTLLFFAGSVQAQVSVHLSVGTPPMWGPSGYTDVRYYYLPDVEAYYDVPSSMFIYYNGYTWVHRPSLPSRYRNYDLYGGYKVPMSDYRGNKPYSNFRQHKMQYARGYRGQEQHNIGERPQRGNNNEGNYSRSHDKQKDNRDNDRYKGRGNDHGKGNSKEKGRDR
jgi:hypothetical protein